MLAWFGGIAVDLRGAELAPGARLSLRTFCGGIAVKIPPGWRVESSLTGIGGGVDTKGSDDPEAPVLAVDGVALLGGVAVGSSGYASNSNDAQTGQ